MSPGLITSRQVGDLTSLAAGSWLERVADRLAGHGDNPKQESPQVPGEFTTT